MADGGRATLGRTVLRATTRALQLVLVGLVGYNAFVGDLGLLVNSLLMLGIALIPDGFRYRYGLHPHPVVPLLVATAPLLHAVGAMGPYRTVPAFDQVAHAVSASIVAGMGYVIVRVLETEHERVRIPPNLRFVFILIFATSFGVAWELLEFATGLLSAVVGGEPLLAQYGPSDVVLDLLFNSIGGVAVALWGTTYFDGIRRFVSRRVTDEP